MMDTAIHFSWLGVTMMGLAAIVILGLLILLLFLAVARHRMLGLAILAFVALFVGLPLLWRTATYREAVSERARAEQEMRMKYDQVRWAQNQSAKSDQRPGHSRHELDDLVTLDQPTQANSASRIAQLEPAERLTHEWPHTMARDGSAGFLAEIDELTEMDCLGTVEESGVGTDLMATAGPPAVAAAEVVKPPPAGTEPAPAVTTPSVPSAAVLRPDWVQTSPERVDGHPAEVLVSDPFETGQECEQDIQRRMMDAIQRFADRQGQRIGAPRGLSLPVRSEDLHRVSRARFVDVIPTSVGPMNQAYRLIVFDDTFCRVLDRRISEAVIGQRLVRTGAFSGGVLLLVGSLFGILKGASRRQARAASA